MTDIDTNLGSRYRVIPSRQTREQRIAYARHHVEMARLHGPVPFSMCVGMIQEWLDVND